MSRRLTDDERKLWEEAAREAKKLRKNAPRNSPSANASPSRGKAEGKKDSPPLSPHSNPPKGEQKKPLPLAPLSKREADKRFKSYNRIEATLDLHGMTQDEAHTALNRFIDRAHRSGKRHVAVITGKGSRGEGVLKRAVPRWLELPELRCQLSAIRYAAPEKGGEGVLHLLLKK